MKYKKTEKISLKNQAEINEKLIQEIIADDPSIIGLGDLDLRDLERPQPKAGRLDILLQDPLSKTRYEVELQLGKTDESHIIRTIEYWDLERKRYPQYDHVAVIIAEDITSRFLNIISLFNGSIPIVGIQMTASRIGDEFTLAFTEVLGLRELGFDDDDDDNKLITDRAYWENKANKDTVKLADLLLEDILEFDNEYALKYNKHYIGLAKNGIANNFIAMHPKKKTLNVEIKSEKDDEIEKIIEEYDIDLINFHSKWKVYYIRLTKEDVVDKKESIKKLLYKGYKYFND
jgi:hypothetical protein